MLRSILAYHLAFLVLLTNVGIPVFTHVCNGQGKSWSSILLPARLCCGKKKETKPVEACHVADRSCKKGIQSRPCCENHAQLLKTQSDFFNPLSVWVVKTLQQDFVALPLSYSAFVFSAFSQTFSSFQPHATPMPLHGRSLLIFKQVFRC